MLLALRDGTEALDVPLQGAVPVFVQAADNCSGNVVCEGSALRGQHPLAALVQKLNLRDRQAKGGLE